MASYKAKNYEFNNPITVHHAGSVIHQRVVVEFSALTVLAANDVLLLGKIPQDYVLEDIRIDLDETIANAVVNVGVLNEAETAVEHLVISAGSLATAGFVRGNSAKALRHGRFDEEQSIGAVITTGGSAAAGTKIGFTLVYRNAQFNE